MAILFFVSGTRHGLDRKESNTLVYTIVRFEKTQFTTENSTRGWR